MRLMLCVLGAAAALMFLSGCATVTKTSDENVATWGQIADLDARMLADDTNLIFLADRQTRLTRWYTR